MSLVPSFALAVLLGASPVAETPSPEQVRRTVERGLVFLEKSGSAWWSGSKCASCHHVPISVWSLTEAREHGFAVNEQALATLRNGSLASYADHPKFKPAAQDGKEKLSLNTVYLTFAGTAAAVPDDKSAAALKKLAAHLLANQEADGSWKGTYNLAPISDATEVVTMQALLALGTARDRGLVDDRWTAARDRALQWLRKAPHGDVHQALVFRLLTAKRFDKAETVGELVNRLLAQQNADGGWSQASKRPSDALATGQSLYALAVAGVDPRQPSIQRAEAFLVRTQQKDGSWNVPIRSQKNSGRAISHYGSGWAALGLVRTLAARNAAKPQVVGESAR